MLPALLAARDVADRFGVDSTTVRNWCNAGLFPNAQQVGRQGLWVIPETDLDGFRPPGDTPPLYQPKRPRTRLTRPEYEALGLEATLSVEQGQKVVSARCVVGEKSYILRPAESLL